MERQPLTTRDDFEYWLANMDDAIDSLFEQVPVELKERLDFSVNSLEEIEQWILSKYENTKQMLSPNQAQFVNSITCYVGETFRKNLGGRWTINLDDSKFAFFGLPILTNFPQESTPFCPLALTTATADRRTGKYLKTILQLQIDEINNK